MGPVLTLGADQLGEPRPWSPGGRRSDEPHVKGQREKERAPRHSLAKGALDPFRAASSGQTPEGTVSPSGRVGPK